MKRLIKTRYMLSQIYHGSKGIIEFIFLRKLLYPIYKILFQLSLRGLGFDNSRNVYASGEINTLKHLRLSSAPTIVDCGARIGTFSKAVKSLYPESRVIAIEPNPALRELLDNLSKTLNIEVLFTALYNIGDTSIILYDFPNKKIGSSLASLFPEITLERSSLNVSDLIQNQVKCTTLDNLFDLCSIKEIDLLKIDSEGSEYEILKGGINSINQGKIKYIMFEFEYCHLNRRISLRDFELLLPNYQFHRILADGGLVPFSSMSKEELNIYSFQNILCINKST